MPEPDVRSCASGLARDRSRRVAAAVRIAVMLLASATHTNRAMFLFEQQHHALVPDRMASLRSRNTR